MAETPRYAHLIVVLFLGSGFAAACCLLLALGAWLYKSTRLAKCAACGAAGILLSYVTLWLLVAMATPDRTLQVGSWKYFCEADCHIAYSIDQVRFASTIGPEGKLSMAQGKFAVVRLKTWFDERSIAPFRGNAPLLPDARTVVLLNEAGTKYRPLPVGPGREQTPSTPLRTPLRPGESYSTELVFDVPANAGALRLLVADADPISRLLVDHENSPLHGKIYLLLPIPPPSSATALP